MKQTLILIIISILISCQPNKKDKMDELNHKDSVSNQDTTYHALSDTENLSLWNAIDKLNNELSKLDKYPSKDVLERLFKESVTISNSNELSDEFEKLRSEAYDSDDFSIIDQYVNRCNPAITVAISGESNSIGANIDYFITKCRPKTPEYKFFELAKDGFYTSSNLMIGTAEFPQWIEETESSFQGIVIKEKAEIYLQKWKSIQKEQKGFYRVIADTTIDCLQTEINGTTSIETKTNLSSSLFVSGLTSAKVFTSEQADKGSEYNYKDDNGRIFKIECFFNQVGIMFYADNENNQRDRLDTKFEVGYTSNGEMVDLKKTSKFLIGQYDFDADDIDELIIAIQDNDDVGDNGITVNVFKLKNDKWNRIGVLTARGILGEPIAIVKMNSLKIERHLRGFYYQWTLENGKFKDTGDY